MDEAEVNIQLTLAEAVVLDEFLLRFRLQRQLSIEDPSEALALLRLQRLLARQAQPSPGWPELEEASAVLREEDALEERLLGGLTRSPVALPEAVQVVRREDFQGDAHRIIFDALAALHEAGVAIDLVTLAQQLHERDQVQHAGGYVRLAEIWEAACAPGQALALARQLRALGERLT
jgi:hypothetical protein